MLSYLFQLLALSTAVLSAQGSRKDACLSLASHIALENTTLLKVEHISANNSISTAGSCQSVAIVTSNACRIFAVTNTTSTSAVHFEMWLPDVWFGRFLAVGNGGLGGCWFNSYFHISDVDRNK